MRHSNNYEFFRSWMRIGAKYGFYSNHQTAGFEENVLAYKDHPAIFTADHQNALIDALNLAAAVNKEYQMFFMTRSDVFGSKFDKLLFSWKLRPIYRAQDNIVDVAKANEGTFNEMVEELGKGDRLLIFPEGNHGRIRRLRPLKKGFARIGFQAAEAHNYELDLLLHPTGIVYWEHLYAGAEVLVKFGPPIKFSDYYEDYKENPNKALINIRRDTFNAMKKLIHHITNVEFYDVIDFSREAAGPALLREENKDPDQLDDRFLREQEVIDLLESKIDTGDAGWDQFVLDTEAYKASLDEAGITDAEVSAPLPSAGKIYLKGLFFVLWYPVYLVGAIIHFFPHNLGERMAVNKFKDDHFHSSIRFTIPLFLYPVYWLVIWLIGWAISGSLIFGIAWGGLILISAVFSMKYHRALKKFKRVWAWFRIRSGQKDQAEKILSARKSWWGQLKTWKNSAPIEAA